MPTLLCNVSALAVATLYYYWRNHHCIQEQQHGLLRQRVTYMLWVMSSNVA